MLCTDNGMDMLMDGTMSSASSQMLRWFQLTPGDKLAVLRIGTERCWRGMYGVAFVGGGGLVKFCL